MENPAEVKNLYQFTVKDIDGNDFNFSDLKGKKIMIVNTASECGFTPQYPDLEELYQKYKNHNFTIIGFPSNNFKGQEPGSNADIKKFCTGNYNVTFPMMSKIDVVGENQAPIYQFLTQKSENGVIDAPVEWNFQKFLINEDGTVARVYYSRIKPTDAEIMEWIEE
ncbi:glutathione peroxidase [Ornithobacterium rhinotracheale]|nr:glutathione peroxidase [Ornithobacterium rhinotracheale]